MSDLIDRQAAIDALDQIFDRCEEIEAHLPEGDPDRTGYKMYPDYMTVWKYLHQLPSAQPEIIRCKDCKHFEYDHPYIIQGIPVLGHEVCNAWGDGCKTDEPDLCASCPKKKDGDGEDPIRCNYNYNCQIRDDDR